MATPLIRMMTRSISYPKSAFFQLNNNNNKRFYSAAAKSSSLDVGKLAETARISLTPQQVEEFAPKIRQVIDWFGQLQAVDLDSIEPAIRADTDGDNLRDDVPAIFDNRDAIIAAVPTYEDSYIKVPKVLNKE